MVWCVVSKLIVAVAAWLRTTYPNANLVIKDYGIGGCASQCLVAPSEHDIYPFYPDLVIFHVYGSNTDYETIVRTTRERTTAEMLLQTDHFTGDDSWSDQMSYTFIPQYANTYQCGIANIRDPWKRYLTANSYQPSQLLSDDVHLNAQGNYLMAALIERNLAYKSTLAADPNGLVKEYHVGTDAAWQSGTLAMRFAGNRVDVVFDNTGAAGTRATVLVDGARPSTNAGCYSFTRPNGAFGAEWIDDPLGKDWPWETGAIMRVTSNAQRLVEDWTVTITRFASGTDFSFSVAGTRTGADGSGSYSGTDPFVSTSRRVVIRRADWWLANLIDTSISVGHTIKWSAAGNFADTVVAPSMTDPATEYTVTLAQGLTNADHQLTLTALGATVPIKAIRVYRPFYNRASSTVPDPLPVAVQRAAGPVARAMPASRGLDAAVRYDLRGRRTAAPRVGQAGVFLVAGQPCARARADVSVR